MANVDRPNGLRPVKHLTGAPYNGQANKYYIPSTDGTAVFVGDAVKSAGSADADGIPTVAQAAAGDAIRGVVVGVIPVTSSSTIYREASTSRYVLVADSPDILFEIQEDSGGGALAATDVGNNADIVVGSGSTTTGTSGMELDSSTKNTTSAQLRIVELIQTADNAIGTNAKWLVKINEHELTSTTGE
jgi:hypothetical protein